jgi:hypothetical protein
MPGICILDKEILLQDTLAPRSQYELKQNTRNVAH